MSVHKWMWQILACGVCVSVACGNKPEGSTAALYGVGNLVSADALLFTLSTNKNELRVLDLNSSDRVRGPHFVLATNPLEPLSIPVLDYPNILAADIRWEDELLETGEVVPEGRTEGGPFVYVASHGRPDISIVGGTREWLKEVKRFSAKAPVTALAARNDGSVSTLFFATYDGTEGGLWALELGGVQGTYEAPPETLSPRLLQSYPSQLITAMAVLPGGGLAVALRGLGGEPSALHISDATQTTWRPFALEQAFRMLATHAGAKHAGGTLPAGKWLYALVDEGSCEGECGGLVAVDVESGELVVDAVGLPMRFSSLGGMPIAFGFTPVKWKGEQTLAGIYVTGSGQLGMFEAATPSSLETTKATGVSFVSPNEAGEFAEVPYEEGPKRDEEGRPTAWVSERISLDETVLIGIEAVLPGVVLENSSLQGTRLEPVGDTSRVQAGDILEIFAGEAHCGSLGIVDTEEGALTLTGALPAGCPEEPRFELRAAGANPYVVIGAKTGYMGRAGPNSIFSYAPAGESVLSIEFGRPLGAAAKRGARWELVLGRGYGGPRQEIQGLSLCSTRIAAGIWIDSVRKKAYISFSSSNALVELDTEAWIEAVLGEGEVACYR